MVRVLRSKVINSLTELEGNTLNRYQRLNRTDLIASYIEDLERENYELRKDNSKLKEDLISRESDLKCMFTHYDMLHKEFDLRVKEIEYGKIKRNN